MASSGNNRMPVVDRKRKLTPPTSGDEEEFQVVKKNRGRGKGKETPKGGSSSKKTKEIREPEPDLGDTDDEHESWVCEACNEEFTGKACRVFECERCEKHYCNVCLKLSVKEYNLLSKRPDMHWFCPDCENSAVTSIRIDRDVAQRCAEYFAAADERLRQLEKTVGDKADKKKVREIEERILAAEKSIDAMKTKETTIEKSIEGIKTKGFSSAAVNQQDMRQHAYDAANEQHEIEKRKMNLILHNLPESTATVAADRIAYDTKLVVDLCQSQFTTFVPAAGIKPVRMGKKRDDGKPRLMRVEMTDPGTRRELLRRAKELRKSTHDTFKYVYICPDLSPRQREENPKLMVELTRRRQEGETDLMIRRGRIVKVPPSSGAEDSEHTGDRPSA